MQANPVVSMVRRGRGRTALLLVGTLLCAIVALSPGRVTAVKPAPQFLRDVAPILDKQGCSVAGCHGKFGGRAGFQLSLLTLTPEDDYDPIVRGGRGRRINLVEPEKSLFLLKGAGLVPHGGGARFDRKSPEYRIIRDWIAAGAPYDPEKDVRLERLTVLPSQFVLPKVGATQQLKVFARFSDGTVQNVTDYANYESVDTAVAAVDANGRVKATRWGGGAVVVRYLGTVEAAFLTSPRVDKTPYPPVRGNNYIDELVLANLKRMNVVPSRLTTDYEFLRRVYLDVCGRLPEPGEVAAFVADKAPDKRAKMIDRLLDSPEYVDMRTLRLGDLLRIHPRNFGYNIQGDRSSALFTDWIRDAVRDNLPYDQFVRGLILAKGSTLRNGPANFYLIDRTPEDRMETVAQAFLGQRMSCARCHKHPFDRWTTDDYWNFAAFLGRVGLRGGQSRLNGDLAQENDVFYNPGGQVVNNSVTGKRRGKVAPPTYLGAKDPVSLAVEKRPDGQPGPNLLEQFANWCVSEKNPYFARATVNRLWGNYLGRGVVHPVDDMRGTTPPSVPGLLEAMARDFTEHRYDIKHMIRTILNSRTYQTASDVNATNKLDDKFFSHFYPRPMLGQVFLDVMNQATGTTERFGEFPVEYKAKRLELPVGSYFLDTFGRSHREFLAELEPKVEPTLVQILHILNSPYIDDKVKHGGGTVHALVSDKAVTDERLIEGLYRKTFCRPPMPKETVAARKILKAAKNREEAAQDLMWALLSAREFYFVI
ncbi:MAG: DUF1549 domain-containing protein [Capsulimonadales bacterium]|nr:DUF1549 domain-containing protein [Capsulimonadales bacterium]